MSKEQSVVDQAMGKLEDMKVGNLLNTEEKKSRYRKAAKAGYSKEFALIFALQEK